MADYADEYSDSLEEFISSELETRKALRARGAPCITCKEPAYALENGTITKHCKTCWLEEYQFNTLPAALLADFAKRGITEK